MSKKTAEVKLNRPVIVSGDNIKVHWNKAEGADGYLVYKKVSGKWKRIAKVGGNTLSYIDKTTKIGGKTQYTVKA